MGETQEETKHSVIKIVPQNVHTFDFINLLQAVSLKLSGENGTILFENTW